MRGSKQSVILLTTLYRGERMIQEAPALFTLPFKGRAGVGMGLEQVQDAKSAINPTPILSFYPKGHESLRGRNELFSALKTS